MTIEHGWRETAPGKWLAWQSALDSREYRLKPSAGFREWASRSVLWDCPRCEQRVLLLSYLWDFADDLTVLVGWRGACRCGADVTIALEGIPDDTCRCSVGR